MSENWRSETKPWDSGSRKIYNPLKIPESVNSADVVILTEPKQIKTMYGDNFNINVGYLGGNAIYQVKDSDGKKTEHQAETGGIYGVWLAKSLTQALVNLFPDEDDELVGKVVKLGRKRVQSEKWGSYLGYTAEELDSYNTSLVERITEKFVAEAGEESTAGDPTQEDVENTDLEVGAELLGTGLAALGSMSFPQIDNFMNSRQSAGLIKTSISAEEIANFCVAKDPSKYEITSDGDVRSLVLK